MCSDSHKSNMAPAFSKPVDVLTPLVAFGASARLAHLVRMLSTWSGSDRVFMLYAVLLVINYNRLLIYNARAASNTRASLSFGSWT